MLFEPLCESSYPPLIGITILFLYCPTAIWFYFNLSASHFSGQMLSITITMPISKQMPATSAIPIKNRTNNPKSINK